jgi:hypothetical protein
VQDVSQRRYDGHSGKHNCLYCPQYFLEATSHWPFIRRVSAVSSRNLAYPAFRSLIEGWNPSPLNATEGVWEAPFVQSLRSVMTMLGMRMNSLRAGFRTGSTTWARRPAYCTEARFQSLLGVRRWDHAVDLGVAFQRGLREMEAWVEMVKLQREYPLMDIRDFREANLPAANDD